MSTIAVGILCGRGETDEALEVIRRVNGDPLVSTVLPLFGAHPNVCRGKFIFYPPSLANRRGASRTAIVRTLASLRSVDYAVILDDDTLPDPGYFEVLSQLPVVNAPMLYTGKLRNADGQRSWDVCSFHKGNPVVVPYEFWDNSDYAADLYFSGPQHIFNSAGIKLAAQVGYPDVEYGEDTQFCRQFRLAGGLMEPILKISAQLLHQHTAPNTAMW